MKTVRQLLREGESTLVSAGVPDARMDAEYLLSSLMNINRMEMLLRGNEPCAFEQEFHRLLLLRAQRHPLQYLLGTQDFCGLTFDVDSRVLIPRPETELLVEEGLAILRKSGKESPMALDLCTGSGAIAAALKHAAPNAKVFASDVSGEALYVAARNAEKLGMQVSFLQGDLWLAVEGMRFDLILSNPPYIASEACTTLQEEVRFEPLLALDGGEDGLDFYRRIADGAASHLLPGGNLLLEIGSDQGESVPKLLKDAGFSEVSVLKDYSGLDRMVSGHL